MKHNDTHPDYHEIWVVMTDGTTFKTRSTFGSEGGKLVLDTDYRTHPAWTKSGQHLVDRGGRLSRFKKRYAQYSKLSEDTEESEKSEESSAEV